MWPICKSIWGDHVLLNNGQVVPLAPQALGETTPVMATGYFYPKDGMLLERRFAYYAELYKSQPWIAAAINKRANAVARLSLNVWDNSPNNGKNLDTGSAYAKLLRVPCPYLSEFAFWRWFVSTYDVYGEAFLYKLRNPNTGQVTALLPMHPSRTFIKRASADDDWPGAKAGDVQYVFTMGTATYGYLTAETSDVVSWMRYNPDTEMRGWSLLEPLRSTIMNEDSARRAMAAWWRNMGRPSLALSVDKTLSPDMGKRIKADFDSIHSGSDNAGSTIVLPSGMTAIPIQLDAEEMAYIESRKLNREEIAGVFDMPPPVLQITDNATFSNITEQMRSFYRDSMAPLIEDLESLLDVSLKTEFPGNKFARFAVDEVLRGNIETRATTAVSLVTNGIAKPAEVRPWFDFNDAGEVTDQLYANSALQPLGSIKESIAVSGPTAELVPEDFDTAQDPPAPAAVPAADGEPPTPPQPAAPPPAAPKAGKFYRPIMGRLGRGKSFAEVAGEMLAAVDDSERTEMIADLALAERKSA
jgi:HK97 family phage portal protein